MQPSGQNGRGSRFTLGVDVGGTFTDGLLYEPQTGEMRWTKTPTTPDDQSRGTFATLEGVGVDTAELGVFCHGTTVGINALLQRDGAKIGLVCTEGMRDLLDVGRFTREPSGLYDPEWQRPHQARPVVHRRHIREITARTLYDGSTHVEFDEEQVRREIEFLRDEGVEAIAVCLLHAYVDLDHERRVIELIHELMPDCYVQSSAVRPVVGEYNRTTAAVLDAYTGPVVTRYLRKLDARLRGAGYDGPAVIMQMNGGVRTLERTAADFPAYTMLSGPVAGLLGAEYYARHFLGVENLVCVDIGGTSTDLGLVVDGIAQTVPEWEAEWRLTLGVPAVDVRSIGAGGGSLIQTDEMGTLRVGPESAGAVPGPASYGRGSTQPTITDAHVLLGVIRADARFAGNMTLDVDAARAAMGTLADRLRLDPYRLAAGALQLMNASIETEIGKMIFERGVDLRSFSLLSYGGAGSLHAVDVARAAGIGEVIVPQVAGGFSALGLVTARPKVEQALSRVEDLDQLGPDELNTLFRGLEDQARADLVDQGVAPDDIAYMRVLSAMYTGQGISNDLPLAEWPVTNTVIEDWKRRFDELYERLYGFSVPEMGITVTTLTLQAAGPSRELRLRKLEVGGDAPSSDALIGRRPVRFSGTVDDAPFYRREALLAGNRIAGPAVVEEDMTTIALPAHAEAVVDSYGNLRIALETQ